MKQLKIILIMVISVIIVGIFFFGVVCGYLFGRTEREENKPKIEVYEEVYTETEVINPNEIENWRELFNEWSYIYTLCLYPDDINMKYKDIRIVVGKKLKKDHYVR